MAQLVQHETLNTYVGTYWSNTASSTGGQSQFCSLSLNIPLSPQAFSKKLTDRRKEWLTSWLEDKKERRRAGINESFLYGEQTSSLSYSDFINKELILFSNADNERSIPSMVDGLKPGQRKVLFTCFKRNDKREIKVAQLAGSVAELSAYHHGEVRE